MSRHKLLTLLCVLSVAAALSWGPNQAAAQAPPIVPYPPNPTAAMGFNPAVNYVLPNFSQSPNVRKFVDSLPGLGAPGCTLGTAPANYRDGTCNQNNLGQYIPIAVPDTATYPGSVFYNLAVHNYSVRMSSDLPAGGTALRGYRQVQGAGAGQTNDPAIGNVNQYLGPAIIAREFDPTKTPGAPTSSNLFGVGGNGWPVRVKFDNLLPLSNTATATLCATHPSASPTLCLPLDTTIMGAGMGPMGPHRC